MSRGVRTGSRPRLGRPADSDSAVTRARIIECARESFARDGFDGTTNKQIADAVGISTAALYHYFPSKAEMYVGVCESIADTFVTVFGRTAGERESFEDRVVQIIKEVGILGEQEPSVMTFITSTAVEVRAHPEVSRGTEALQREFQKQVDNLLQSAKDADKVLRGSSIKAFTDLLIGVLSGFSRMNARGQHDQQVAAGEVFISLIKASTRH